MRGLRYASIMVVKKIDIPQKNVEPLLVACFNNMEALVCLIELKQATLKPHAVNYDNMSL